MAVQFKLTKLNLEGAFLIEPFFAKDKRGGFVKDFSDDLFKKNDLDFPIKEVFYTISRKGVIRAIHFQEIHQQPKLVRCVSGRIFDVIVDLRPGSPTFKKYLAFYLSGENRRELLIPEHFGHGYLVLEDSIVSYKCAEKFYPENDSGIIYNDPVLNIKWPLEEIGGIDKLIISDKDLNLQSFEEYNNKGCI